MKISGNGRNLFIKDNKAELFDSLGINNSMLSIFAAHRVVIELNTTEIHACLYCKELRNISIVLKGNDIYKISLITETEQVFEILLDYLQKNMKQVEFSVQDKKINGYTTAIVEKLLEGTVLTIIDKKDDSDIIYCPECGVQCDPIIPYCMECGAMIG